MAPTGKQWFCMACGKRSADLYGSEGSSWDESCAMNAIQVVEGAQPTAEQAEEFRKEHEQTLADIKQRFETLIAKLGGRLEARNSPTRQIGDV